MSLLDIFDKINKVNHYAKSIIEEKEESIKKMKLFKYF